MDHKQWIDTVSGGSSVRQVARRSGVVHRTLARQITVGNVSAPNIVAIAQAYGVHPVDALVETGHLEAKWATRTSPLEAARAMSADDLAAELRRRMVEREQAGPGNVPSRE